MPTDSDSFEYVLPQITLREMLRKTAYAASQDDTRKTLKKAIERIHASSPNIFGEIAQTAAYLYGDEWMDAVVEYVQENRDYAVREFAECLPVIGCRPQEGTYLMWLDFTGLGLPHEDVLSLLVNKARVAMNDGLFFGEEGRGWFRMNLATPRANVEMAFENISKAIRSR